MEFMELGGEFHDRNASQWADQKNPSFTGSIYSDNTNWETAAVWMSVSEEAISKATGRDNAPLECWGRNNSIIYHIHRFKNYRNFPKKRYPDVAGRAKTLIQEYAQKNPEMGGNMITHIGQYGIGQTSSTTKCYMSEERRAQISQLWN